MVDEMDVTMVAWPTFKNLCHLKFLGDFFTQVDYSTVNARKENELPQMGRG